MAVTPPSWLDHEEGDRLEYKSAETIRRREAIPSVVRAVVGLLNHKGGHVVIGVDDEGKPENVDLSGERERLQHILDDSIEPSPFGKLHVKSVQVLGAKVLEIEVTGSAATRPLYAERRHGLYGFWMRSGSTTRALTLAEVERRKSPDAPPTRKRWDGPLAKHGDTENEIVLVLQAQLELKNPSVIELTSLARRQELIRRKHGWAVVDEYSRFERKEHNTIQGDKHGAHKWLCFDLRNHTIRFEGRRDFLKWNAPQGMVDPVIYPFPLVEGSASFFWLLHQYLEVAQPVDGDVHCQLGIWHPEGWRLGPHRPGSIAWLFPDRWKSPHDNTNIERVADVSVEELRSNPDAITYPFVKEVYEDFGYDESVIPFWVEAKKRFEFEP